MTPEEEQKRLDWETSYMAELVKNLDTKETDQVFKNMIDALISSSKIGVHIATLAMMSQVLKGRDLDDPEDLTYVMNAVLGQIPVDQIIDMLYTHLSHSIATIYKYAKETGQDQTMLYSVTKQCLQEQQAVARKAQEGNAEQS